jgi:hypothetical protein
MFKYLRRLASRYQPQLTSGYQPELHYMRGPGPAFALKQSRAAGRDGSPDDIQVPAKDAARSVPAEIARQS